MRNFKELKVWRKSHQFVLEMYRVTKCFPSDERFGLISQLRRSAASVPANIAEACGKEGNLDVSRFLSVAVGSASETEYHLLLARDLGFIEKEAYAKYDQEINDIKRMLYSFIKYLKSNG